MANEINFYVDLATRFFVKHNKSIAHIAVLLFITLCLFAIASAFWSGASLAEALFVLELKGFANVCHYTLTQKIFGAIVFCTNGTGLWPLRLASAICAFVVLLCAYFSAKKLYGVNTAFLAALALATIPGFAGFAVKALPDMWFAVLVSVPVTVWLTGRTGKPLFWARWACIWLSLVLGFLSFGFSAVYIFLGFIICNFVLTKCKKQPFFNRRFWLLAVIFTLSIVALLAAGKFMPLGAGADLTLAGLNLAGFARFGEFSLGRLGLRLLEGMGVWIAAFLVIGVWRLICFARHKPVMPFLVAAPVVWFLATFLPAAAADRGNAGLYLSALPPVAIFIAYYLNRYAEYKNARQSSRREHKSNALTIKLLLWIWGAVVCGAGVLLIFNLEMAWQRELYFETRHLTLLIISGVFIVYLGFRSFWIVIRAYACWGFIIVMLLSFIFLNNAILKPARDILYSPLYFNQNLALLYPDIKIGGLTMAVWHNAPIAETRARYFLYANFPVEFMVLTASDLIEGIQVLPTRFVVEAHALADWGPAIHGAGYQPVYWEEVDGVLLVVMEKSRAVIGAEDAGIVLAATDGEEGLWASGFCYGSGYLASYTGAGELPKAATQIIFYPRQNLRLFNVVVNEGLRNPRVFRWLATAGAAAPRGAYTGLVLHYKTPYINKHWPYSASFQKWALETVMDNIQPNFTAFTGLTPSHSRTRRVLAKMLPSYDLRHIINTSVFEKISVEKQNDTVFLRFYLHGAPRLSLGLRVNR